MMRILFIINLTAKTDLNSIETILKNKRILRVWRARRDSNSRPPDYEWGYVLHVLSFVKTLSILEQHQGYADEGNYY